MHSVTVQLTEQQFNNTVKALNAYNGFKVKAFHGVSGDYNSMFTASSEEEIDIICEAWIAITNGGDVKEALSYIEYHLQTKSL